MKNLGRGVPRHTRFFALLRMTLGNIECEWPNTKPIVDEIYADVPADEKYKMWAGNAVDFFKLEQTAKVKEPAPVGD